MNRVFTLIFLAAISVCNGQSFYGSQYAVGTPVNDSITSTPISDPGPGGCYPSASYTVTFPISKVTGVENYMLITAVSPGNSLYTTQKGTVHAGDMLTFTSETPSYDFYFPKGGGIVYTIKARGTPKTADETYACGQFVETTYTNDCPDVVTYTFIQTAKVQATQGNTSQPTLKIMPLVNFTQTSYSKSTNVSIDASISLKDAKFELYDTYGRRAKSIAITDRAFTINRDGLDDGTYFWKVINNNMAIGLGKVIITH